jgi:hypothetical protein
MLTVTTGSSKAVKIEQQEYLWDAQKLERREGYPRKRESIGMDCVPAALNASWLADNVRLPRPSVAVNSSGKLR